MRFMIPIYEKSKYLKVVGLSLKNYCLTLKKY